MMTPSSASKEASIAFKRAISCRSESTFRVSSSLLTSSGDPLQDAPSNNQWHSEDVCTIIDVF